MANIIIKGLAEWVHATSPSTKFVKPHGVYEAGVYLPEAEAAKICEELDAMAQAKLKETLDEAPPQKREKLAQSLTIATPYKRHEDYKTGAEDGNILFKTKLQAVRKMPDGSEVEQRPAVMDSKKTPITDKNFEVGNESLIKVSIEPYPYYMPSTKTVGVSLRLKGLMVIKYKAPANDATAGMEEEEDGFVASAVEKDDSADMFDDNYATPSEESSDAEGDF